MDFRYRYLPLFVAFCIASVAIQGCHDRNRESAWNGTWKLNVSKSEAYGRYSTIAIAPNGVVTLTNEAFSFNFRCNNEEFQNGAARSTACTALNARQWKLTNRTNGKDTGTAIWDISPDSRTLTIRPNTFQGDGTQSSSELIYARRGGTKGFAGRWQQITPLRSRPNVLDVALNGQRLHLAYPEIGQYSDSPLDGSIVPVHGPLVQPGASISVRAISPREFYTEQIVSGRVIRKGSMDIGEDGRTLLAESWTPANPDEKDRLVYDKQ